MICWTFTIILSCSPIIMEMLEHNKGNSDLSESLCLILVPPSSASNVIFYFALGINALVFGSIFLIIIWYIQIYHIVATSKVQVQQYGQIHGGKKDSFNRIRFSIICVTAASIISWTPFLLITLVKTFSYNLPHQLVFIVIFGVIPINCLFNPCYYTVCTKKFMEDIKHCI